MRWHILRTLWLKEASRHLADRSGLILAVLLIAAAGALSVVGGSAPSLTLAPTLKTCYLDAWEPDPWLDYLRAHSPASGLRLEFRLPEQFIVDERGIIQYDKDTGAIQLQPQGKDTEGRPRYAVQFWCAGKDWPLLAPYEDWFWRTSLTYHASLNLPLEIETTEGELVAPTAAFLVREQPGSGQANPASRRYLYWEPDSELSRHLRTMPAPVQLRMSHEELRGLLDDRVLLATTAATFLVIFAVCFFAMFLLPSLTCEERERGLLVAQYLSPASLGELVVGKLLFYPLMGLLLGGVLAGCYHPAVLLRPLFWLVLLLLATSYAGVGLTIGSLARTQRRASLGAMSYLLAMSLLLLVGRQLELPLLNLFILEYHTPRLLQGVLSGTLTTLSGEQGAAFLLGLSWLGLGITLFRWRGWQ
jgi:hypothetical protein